MAKFMVHKYNQIYMAALGIHSFRLHEPTIELFKKVFPYYAIIVSAFATGSSFMFLYKNAHEVKEALESLKVVAGGFQSTVCFFVVGFQLKKIKVLHLKLQGIINAGVGNEIEHLYWAAEQKCRKYTLRIGLYVILHTLEFGVLLIYAFACIAFGIYNPLYWPLFFKMYFPFYEYRNILSWLVAWFAEFNLSFGYSVVMTAVSSYFVSCSIYISAMCDHFNALVQFINRFTNHSRTQPNAQTLRINHLRCLHLFIKAIKIHVEAVETTQLVTTIFSGAIFALLPANAIFMAVSMFDAEQTVGHFDIIVFGFDLSCIISALLWPSFFCFFATSTTNKIASIGNFAYNSNWYNLPPKFQAYFRLVIIRSQYPVYFIGLGLVRCTLEVFFNLLKTSGSFYMLYRTFAER